MVLAGQPELADRLNEPSLRQLKQRVTLRCTLTPLTLEETASYIAGRIRRAGGSSADAFTQEAVVAIYEASGGIPRTINVLCDNAMLGSFAAQVKPVTTRFVVEVCRDFDLELELAEGEPDAEPDGGWARAPAPDSTAPVTAEATSAPERPAAAASGTAAAAGTERPAAPARRSSRFSPARADGEMFTLYTRKRRFSFF